MDKVRILHTADMHLGANVSMLDSSKNHLRKNEIEQTAFKVFDMCGNVDVALMSGDIFNESGCQTRLADGFIAKIEQYPKTHFFYSCGNHDPYSSSIVQYLKTNAPNNLHIFSPKLEFVELSHLNVRVYGASFGDAYCKTSLLSGAKTPDTGFINILCIHGELCETGIYNPVSLSSLENLGFDYVALGHVHSFSKNKIGSNITYAYPGVPEPNGFDECGKKGVILGDVFKGITSLEFVPVSKRQYIDKTVDISGLDSFDGLLNHINALCDGEDNICRFKLIGKNNLGQSVNSDYISSLINCFHASISDVTTSNTDFKALCNDVTLKGLCATEIVTRLENADAFEKEKIQKAGDMLMDILEGRFD